MDNDTKLRIKPSYSIKIINHEKRLQVKLQYSRTPINTRYILDVIAKCNLYGNGISSMPYNEQIFIIDDDISTLKYIPRETLRRMVTPQAYKFELLYDAYKEAFEKNIGIGPSSYTNTMMVELGHRLYFAAGSDKNIKLTTQDNLELFKAMLDNDDNVIDD